jgi:lysophospholipase L1-like esterase
MRRNRIFGLALALVSLALSLVLGELVLRLSSPGRYYVWEPGTRQIFRPVPSIMPGVEGESRFFINEHGLRGDSFSPDQGYRILAVGGSTTECLYLDETEAWPRLLQDRLNARPGPRVWVGNVGKSGQMTRNHVVQVEKLTRQYPRIDAVLLLTGVNDLMRRLKEDRPTEDLMAGSFAVLPSQGSGLAPVEIRRRLRTVWKRYLEPRRELVQDDAGKVYIKWRRHRGSASRLRESLPDLSAALDEHARNVSRIVEDAGSRGIRVILLTQPALWRPGLTAEEQALLWMGGVGDYQEEPGHEYYTAEALAAGMERFNDVLRGLCRTRSVTCVDLARELPRDTSVFYDDVHFNEAGSRKVAALIGDRLASGR